MFEKYVYLTLIEGGQEKENNSQQIPTFKCSEWSNFKDLHCKDLLLRHIGAMWLSFIWLFLKNMQKKYIIIIINWVFFWTCYYLWLTGTGRYDLYNACQPY